MRVQSNASVQTTLGSKIQRDASQFVNTHNIYEAVIKSIQSDAEIATARVQILGVNNEDATADNLYDARMLSPFAGKDQGFFAMPEIGSHCYVAFTDGNLANAIIIGGYHCTTEEPSSVESPSATEVDDVINSSAIGRLTQSLSGAANVGGFDQDQITSAMKLGGDALRNIAPPDKQSWSDAELINNFAPTLKGTEIPDAALDGLDQTFQYPIKFNDPATTIDSASDSLQASWDAQKDVIKAMDNEAGGTMLKEAYLSQAKASEVWGSNKWDIGLPDSVLTETGKIQAGLTVPRVSSTTRELLSGVATNNNFAGMLLGKVGGMTGMSDQINSINATLSSVMGYDVLGAMMTGLNSQIDQYIDSVILRYMKQVKVFDQLLDAGKGWLKNAEALGKQLTNLMPGAPGQALTLAGSLGLNLAVNKFSPQIQGALKGLPSPVKGAILGKISAMSDQLTKQAAASASNLVGRAAELAGLSQNQINQNTFDYAAKVNYNDEFSLSKNNPYDKTMVDILSNPVIPDEADGSFGLGLVGKDLDVAQYHFQDVSTEVAKSMRDTGPTGFIPVAMDSVKNWANDIANSIKGGQLVQQGKAKLENYVEALKDPKGDKMRGLINKVEKNFAGNTNVVGGSQLTPTPTTKPGSTVPIGWRNQRPSKMLEKFHPYSSFDKKDKQDNEIVRYVPEPQLKIWKTGYGHTVELDDTGYLNAQGAANAETMKYDNRGIRLTTKGGHIIHMTENANEENILIRDFKNNYLQFDTVSQNYNLNVNNNAVEQITGTCTRNVGKSYTISSETTNASSRKTTTISAGAELMLHSEKTISIAGKNAITIGTTALNITTKLNTQIQGGLSTAIGALRRTTLGIDTRYVICGSSGIGGTAIGIYDGTKCAVGMDPYGAITRADMAEELPPVICLSGVGVQWMPGECFFVIYIPYRVGPQQFIRPVLLRGVEMGYAPIPVPPV